MLTLNRFNEITKIIKTSLKLLALTLLACWLAFVGLYIIQQSVKKERVAKESRPTPAQTQTIPEGCLLMGDEIMICEDRDAVLGDVQ